MIKKGRTVVLFSAAFLMNLSIMMINFAVIFFLKDRVGLNSSQIGLYFAAGSIGYAGLCLLLRHLQDKIIPPLSMMVTIVLTIFSLLMIKSSTNPFSVLIYYFLFAAAPAFFWPRLMGWFSYGLSSNKLGKTISCFNISWSSGSLLGPLIGGLIARYDVMLSFYVDLIIIAVIGLMLILGMIFVKDLREYPGRVKITADGPSTHAAGFSSNNQKEFLLNGGKGTFFRFSGWIGVFSVYIVLGMINNIFPLYVRDSLKLDEAVAGNLLFIRGLVSAVGFYLLGRTSGWHFNKKIILLTQTGTIFILLAMLISKSVILFYILFVIFGFLFSLGYSSGIFHGSAGAEDTSRRMALFESFLTIGLVTGTIISGYLYQFFTIQAAFFFAAVLGSIGFVAQMVLMSLAKKRALR